tara:strand:+ start:313 stop:1047 length:735 start_codon:yes stop_codon:yes gene_type:complete
MSEPDNDWRMEGFSHLFEDWNNPWSGQLVPKGTQLTIISVANLTKKKTISVNLPNATALLLNASERSWQEAKKIRIASKIDSSIKTTVAFESTKLSFDYLERVIESILLAFTALEAFINEHIPDDYIYVKKKGDGSFNNMDKAQIERFLSIDEKLSIVLPTLMDIPTPKGKKQWDSFISLKRIRDRVVHMKAEDRRSSGPDIPTLWHELLRAASPYESAKAMCDFFIKHFEKAPRWYTEYPNRK